GGGGAQRQPAALDRSPECAAMRPDLQRGLLAAATPLLILLGIVALLLRQGSDRLQAIPALVIGCALLAQTSWSWRRRRRALLAELRDQSSSAVDP
ncbi:MAG: DUF3188 domain-containing protein, partial [Synechococcaceae cyanobacterium]|nr:DUF3188 domain-containing protein [Synechococcaceae cyanobacterium]